MLRWDTTANFILSISCSKNGCHTQIPVAQVKAMQRYALPVLLCAMWVAAVSGAMVPPSLGHSRALAASGNGTLLAGQALGQV